MNPARLLGRLALTVAVLSVVSCGSAGEREVAVDSTTSTTLKAASATSVASTGPATTAAIATVAPLFAPSSEGPNIATWISVDRAARSDTGTRVRSHSELLYAAPSKEPATVHTTQKVSATRSTFITAMSVSADGRTAYFGETTTELNVTPYRCSMRVMAADQSGQPRHVADGDSPTIAPDSQRLAFQSAEDGSCQTTRLHVLNLSTSERRDFDVADFMRLLPRAPDRPEFAQFAGSQWSPDSRWLAVVFMVPDGWAATAIVDTRDWRLQLVRTDVYLEQVAREVMGDSYQITNRQLTVVAWTADGTLALKLACNGCPPYLYALGTPGSEVAVAAEPKLAGNTQPTSVRWLGSFEDWILVADLNGIVARGSSKSVLLFGLDGYTVNAAWPAGRHSLPRVR